jgi:hypothetical protein
LIEESLSQELFFGWGNFGKRLSTANPILRSQAVYALFVKGFEKSVEGPLRDRPEFFENPWQQ